MRRDLAGVLSEAVRIDAHTHVVPPLPMLGGGFPEFVAGESEGRLLIDGELVRTVPPGAWDVDRRLADMRHRGIDHQVLSPIPPLVVEGGSADEAGQWADGVNEAIAALVERHPCNFSGMGLIAQGHPSLAAAQLQRAHDWGLVGVLIGTDVAGLELDDPALDELFGTAADLGLAMFVHPIARTLEDVTSQRITGAQPRFGLGMTTDTAIAASKLVFGGVLERHPRLRVLLAHGGGTFYWGLTRARRLMTSADRTKVDSALENLFVDSVVYDVDTLRYLIAGWGSERVLFGTDYPLPAEDHTIAAHLRDSGDTHGVQSGSNLRRLFDC